MKLWEIKRRAERQNYLLVWQLDIDGREEADGGYAEEDDGCNLHTLQVKSAQLLESATKLQLIGQSQSKLKVDEKRRKTWLT